MNLATKICGWLIAFIWFAAGGFGLFYVYLLLTFYIFTPVTVAENFRENRAAVIGWSLATAAFLAGAVAVALRRPWGRGLSFILCGLAGSYAAAQILVREAFDFRMSPIALAAIVAIAASIWAWLLSRSGRTYFTRTARSA